MDRSAPGQNATRPGGRLPPLPVAEIAGGEVSRKRSQQTGIPSATLAHRLAQSRSREYYWHKADSGSFKRCPLLGVKRTFVEVASVSAFDPKRTLEGLESRLLGNLAYDAILALVSRCLYKTRVKTRTRPIEVLSKNK